MAKRRATTELNRDNWDVEDEKEDPGTFKRISDAELKNRIIKKAKRSLGNNKDMPGISPFAAFSGFAKSTGSGNPFTFLKNNTEASDSPFSSPLNKDKKENGSAVATEEKKSNETGGTKIKEVTDSSAPDKQKPTRSIEYYRQLQSLNESVMKWMQLHLTKNSCCDFTPVFNDYKKHLDTLNVTYPVKAKEDSEGKYESLKSPASTKEGSFLKKSNDTANHDFKFGNNKSEDETDYGANFKSNTTNTSTFSFGISKTPTATSSKTSRPTTSFEEEAAPEKKPFQFSFGLKNALSKNSDDSNAKPFSFSTSTPVDKSADSELTGEDSEYVPPKNDVVSVKEEDAFYSKRCKLFCKKDEGYVDRGIGVLHLKPLDGKTQLVVRADTSLGNILLNIVLSESLPMSRTGKNNVLLVCIPNPPLDPKNADSKEAIPMLIRVKTSEDADELLETLNKYKS